MIKNVGLIVNTRKKQPVQLGKELIAWFSQREIGVYATEEDSAELGITGEMATSQLCDRVDCVITLGGDGTLLRAARLTASCGVPILGINLGVLGFLTEVELVEMKEALNMLVQGNYRLDERMMLEGKIIRKELETAVFVGLNDIVVKGSLARLINFDIFVDEDYVTTYNADGVIISSPTGSTAYSLSAGGPIIHPELEVLMIIPICPHTLHARPLIISPHKKVRIKIIDTHHDSMLTVDGQAGYQVENDDDIIIGRAIKHTRLVRIKKNNFFDILQEKLKTESRISYE